MVISVTGCVSASHREAPTVAETVETEGPAVGVTSDTPLKAEESEEPAANQGERVEALLFTIETDSVVERIPPFDLDGFDVDEFDQPAAAELARRTPEISAEEAQLERSRAESGDPTFDIPMELNEKVLAWVDYYSNRHHASFEAGLVRSGRYLPMIREIFAEAGLPQDLAYMAHVESSYKTTAYSRAGAKGVMQFIRGTGRKYELEIDYWVDERSDPEKSARAAAAYLTDLHDEFGDWYLALAAYNAGEGRVRRGLKRTGAKDFWALAKTRELRRETRNYVPAILAATLISKSPEKYGFDFEAEPPVDYDTIVVNDAVDLRVLAKCADTDLQTLKKLNPALRRHQTPPNRKAEVRVPTGSASLTLAALDKVPEDERILYTHHVIRQGDTLWEISRGYGVSVRAIQDANGMGRRTLLSLGRVLKIPTATSSSYASIDELPPSVDGALTYRVRRGDTLSHIARRYSTTPSAIAAASGISVRKTLQIGERLQVVPNARTATQARNAVGGSSTVAAARHSGSGGSRVHTVRRGDTLWRIARSYRTSVDEICSVNAIRPDAVLYPGTRLTVPAR
jgi:membrane-bound lytic murein transglycosylase D